MSDRKQSKAPGFPCPELPELITWRDIASHKGGHWSDEPTSGGSVLCYTAGWVTHEDDIDITVHSTITDGAYGHDTVIPIGCVVSRRTLK